MRRQVIVTLYASTILAVAVNFALTGRSHSLRMLAHATPAGPRREAVYDAMDRESWTSMALTWASMGAIAVVVIVDRKKPRRS